VASGASAQVRRPAPSVRVAGGLSQIYLDEHAFPMVSASVRLPFSSRWSVEPEVRRDAHHDYGRTVVLLQLTYQTAGRRYVTFGTGRYGTDRFGADPGLAAGVRVGWRFQLGDVLWIAPELGSGWPGFVVGGVSVGVGRN
jgi:hypothetical protein